MTHSALHAPVEHGVEQVDRLQAGPRRDARRVPEAAHPVDVGRVGERMCAASWLASPPTSRPPIAFGWPVSENGPMPGRPIRPVARWQLMSALTLSVPAEDWFTPCE